MSQSLKYGGIHGNHFEYIKTTVTSLFLGRFWKYLHQNKCRTGTLLQDIFTAYIRSPLTLQINSIELVAFNFDPR